MLTNKIFNASALGNAFLASVDSAQPYRRLPSSIWMTRVNRCEKDVSSPSDVGYYSLK